MLRFVQAALGACIITATLAACSGTSTTLPPPGTVPGASQAPQVLYFVTDANANALTAYPLNANGNTPPTRTIAGSSTGLGFPRRVISDAAGNLYVANAPGTGAHSITVYGPSANGNVSPLNTISGSNTGLTGADGMALDSSGNLFVANCSLCFQSSGTDAVLVFAAGASGNVAPAHTISGANTTLSGPTDLAFDAAGNLLVTNSSSNTVVTFAPGVFGNVAPSATLGGANTGISAPECVAFDASGNIYVCNSANATITVYAPGTTGNTAPTRTLGGASTQLQGPTSAAFDSAGNMYVANSGSNSITVYAPGATGNQAPMLTVSGGSTGLVTPIGLALQP